jgi:Domain of unknown function (DUF4136)
VAAALVAAALVDGDSAATQGLKSLGRTQLYKTSEDLMRVRALTGCALCLILAAPVLAQQVSVNYNHGVSFSQFHTYAWGGNNQNAIQNSILAQVAQQDINNALQGKGLQMVQENQNPDLIVTASGGEKAQTSYNVWGMRGIGGGMGGISPEQNVEATMVVSLYNAKAQELVWRGIAQDTLNNNGNKNQEMVNKAVQKMFKQWPKN